VSSCNAPSNGPTWSQKNKTCLNTINNTPDGKFYNFMSPLSMIPGMGKSGDMIPIHCNSLSVVEWLGSRLPVCGMVSS
jgi:hypothetical protein